MDRRPDLDMMEAALRRAFSLGQTYWAQADSEYTSQHRKADETRAKFDALVTETAAALIAENARLRAALDKLTDEWRRQKALFPTLAQDGWMDLAMSEAAASGNAYPNACNKRTKGWLCSRMKGHDGECDHTATDGVALPHDNPARSAE